VCAQAGPASGRATHPAHEPERWQPRTAPELPVGWVAPQPPHPPREQRPEEGWWFRSFLHCDPSWLLCPAAYRLERTYHYLVRSTCRREDRSSRDVHSLVVVAALPCQHRHSAPPARGAGRRVVRGAGESQPPLPTDDSALRKSACDLGLSLVAALPLAPEWWGHRPTSQTRRGRAGGLATARTSVRSPHTRCRYRCTRPESGR
jgi:hypothetical protein